MKSSLSIRSLSPLRGMPLTVLNLGANNVEDLSPLEGMEIGDLRCHYNPVKSLAPLEDMPLHTLGCTNIAATALTPLAGMPLRQLNIAGMRIRDLTPLKDLPLEKLGFSPRLVRGPFDFLREKKGLKWISVDGRHFSTCQYIPAEEFWRQRDPVNPREDKRDEPRSTLEEAPCRKELESQIAKAKQTINRYRGGHVILGRVVLDGPEDPRKVMVQMSILRGGYFAGQTKDLVRPVGFRVHGYAPLDVQLKGSTGDVVDVGTVRMTRLEDHRLLDLIGKVVLEGRDDVKGASIHLQVMHGPVNTPSNGTAPSFPPARSNQGRDWSKR